MASTNGKTDPLVLARRALAGKQEALADREKSIAAVESERAALERERDARIPGFASDPEWKSLVIDLGARLSACDDTLDALRVDVGMIRADSDSLAAEVTRLEHEAAWSAVKAEFASVAKAEDECYAAIEVLRDRLAAWRKEARRVQRAATALGHNAGFPDGGLSRALSDVMIGAGLSVVSSTALRDRARFKAMSKTESAAERDERIHAAGKGI